MDKLIFNSAVALAEQSVTRQILVNELANISTSGFKRSFETAMRSVKAEGLGFDSRYQPRVEATDTINMRPGAVMSTGRPLDISLNGQTVMAVQGERGERGFTRRGDLRVSETGVLETGSGNAVLGDAGTITIPSGLEVNITSDGSVYARDPRQQGAVASQLVGKILLRDASNTKLVRRSDGLFGPLGAPKGSDITGGKEPPSLTPGTLEGSNVNAVEAMVKLIDYSRSFEMQIKIIKETQDNDERGAQLLKLTG